MKRQVIIYLLAPLGIWLGLFVYWCSVYRLVPNFFEVYPHELYRSAQPFPTELKKWIPKYGIKTVINLRGPQEASPWFQQERSAIASMNIKMINVSLGSHDVPHRTEILRLLEAFETAERPILVHCRVGADRTGEAVALYSMIYKGLTPTQAMQWLTPRYLHFSILTPSEDLFIQNFRGTAWLKKDYDPCQPPFRQYYKDEWCPQSKSSALIGS